MKKWMLWGIFRAAAALVAGIDMYEGNGTGCMGKREQNRERRGYFAVFV